MLIGRGQRAHGAATPAPSATSLPEVPGVPEVPIVSGVPRHMRPVGHTSHATNRADTEAAPSMITAVRNDAQPSENATAAAARGIPAFSGRQSPLNRAMRAKKSSQRVAREVPAGYAPYVQVFNLLPGICVLVMGQML